jgi:hypothetical protein
LPRRIEAKAGPGRRDIARHKQPSPYVTARRPGTTALPIAGWKMGGRPSSVAEILGTAKGYLGWQKSRISGIVGAYSFLNGSWYGCRIFRYRSHLVRGFSI